MSEALLEAVAQALADGRRVLVLGDSFELVERLAAAPVKELVVVTALADPDAPAGSTVGGAPLRLRVDWRERPYSKDLVVDAAGDAPADEVARVLKKAGLYLTARVDAPALAGLAHRAEVVVGTAAVVLAGALPPELPDVAALGLPDEAPAHEPPTDSESDGASSPSETQAELARLEAQVIEHARALEAAEGLAQRALELEGALAAARRQAADAEAEAAALRSTLAARQADVATLRSELTIAQTGLEQAASQVERQGAELGAARAELGAARTELATARSELAEQTAEYERNRLELAERRVVDRRVETVKLRFEQARAEMANEIEQLREQLRELGEPAEDAATLVGERDEARRAHDEITEVVEASLRELGAEVPRPPPVYAGDGPRGAWLHAVRHALGVAAAELARLRHRRAELEGQLEGLWIALRERDEALAAAEEAPGAAPPAPATISLDESALREQLEALEAALAAERRARAAEGRAWRERVAAADRILGERSQIVESLAQARQEAARGRLRVAAGEEIQRRLEAERVLRDERITDLEVMLHTHNRMQALLTESLAEIEAARDEAEADRRLLDANVRLLQREVAARPDLADWSTQHRDDDEALEP